jgi:hypothetical protein
MAQPGGKQHILPDRSRQNHYWSFFGVRLADQNQSGLNSNAKGTKAGAAYVFVREFLLDTQQIGQGVIVLQPITF